MDQEYNSLLKTYQRMFGMVDAIHFNSQNTADVYGRLVDVPIESVVIPITHSDIDDHRQLRKFDLKQLKLGFIGSESPYKGFPMLKRVIEQLNKEGFKEKISLSVYGGRNGNDDVCANVMYKGRFNTMQMEAVYNSMDLLVVPSICNETFGFTVLEAIQYGVPVLVSSKVGAKDVVKQYASQFVFETENDLYIILCRLINNREELAAYNQKIVELPWQWSLEKHADEIARVFYDTICNKEI